MTSGEASPAALRLTFPYEGDSVRLAAGRVVAMKAPLSDPVDGYQGQAGFWVEVRDRAGTTIYRWIMHDPMPVYHEVHAQPGSPSTHTPVRSSSGVFEVVVPVSPPGSVVVLFGTPQPAGTPIGDFSRERSRADGPRVGTDPAVEIARFDLDEVLCR
jgi:hypothetical protein